ncbi:MAG: pyridine nucleotide-disulfide oxidoreductase [Gammaproteobacteria bacterium]|nr:MAG: pyridine nucleotide-disulfide oxidoreductase [Gammaproteobacteria bacterium]
MSHTFTRRQMIKALGAGALLASNGFALAQVSNEKVHIVILGCGLAGLASAHRLRNNLPNAKITLIDAKIEHNYQPGYTLVATGVWTDLSKVKAKNADLLPKDIQWIQSQAKVINPDNQTVEMADGKTVKYDYLVVATGLDLRYDLIEGFDVNALGQKGLGSVYHSPEGAQKTWQAMDAFRQQGGQAVMTLAPTVMKCAGAPLKMTFMLVDRLNQTGTAGASKVDFFAPGKAVFSVPVVNKNVLERWKKLNPVVNVNYKHTLKAVDIDAQKATFTSENGDVVKDYGFLHVVPPMTAPALIRENTDLALQKVCADKDWLAVSKDTLQHLRYPNIFGLGDINATPKGKTAATVKKSAPVMVNNLLNTIRGKAPDMVFDGYTSCPLLIREGAAMLVEFNYKNELTPSFSFVDPLQESYFAWYLEEVMLKPAYLSVLKGKV